MAEERGYEVTKEELEAYNESMLSELSEEELGKAAGGFCMDVLSVSALAGISAAVSVTASIGTTIMIFGKE